MIFDLPLSFWARVRITDAADCWPWLGRLNGKGYPKVRIGGRTRSAAAWILVSQGIELDGLEPRHTCDNRACCNVAHILPGTHQQNMDDRRERGRSARQQGEANAACRLTAAQVLKIREEHAMASIGRKRAKYGTVRDLMLRFDISKPLVHAIVSRRLWRHI